ncbi:hypothetical protein BGZ76_006328 [Entomortierella beljakovae]|nr:hypothetical protein BGZ76_006328 [Entomortierella beljakovae]
MSLRSTNSAKNLREQFMRTNSENVRTNSYNGDIINHGVTRSKTIESPARQPVSRKGSLLRSSSGGSNVRRAKSIQKKTNDPDISMEVALLITKRCVKEIRERGLTTKGILRQLQMAYSHEVVLQTIRIILDDDASTALSPLHQIDIHLVAHAMKWAIRYSEEILVTYEDYEALYVDEERDFPGFVRDLKPTNRAILLELFSLCADVTLLAHLNDMTLVTVAKSISLSIMDGPERTRTTFDASFQERNLWAAACEDLLRAFLRIKTTHDLAKIDQEDEVDENRYICNETRLLKSARQRSVEVPLPSLDTSVALNNPLGQPGSAGWSNYGGPLSLSTPRSNYHSSNGSGYFEATPQSVSSPLSHIAMNSAPLSRSHSIAKSSAPASRAMSPTPHADDITEYEELMQDQSHLRRLRQDRNSLLKPAESIRRRSVADMESLYAMSIQSESQADCYDSDPEVCHAHEADEDGDTHGSIIPDFADGLGWDFKKQIQSDVSDPPSLSNFQAPSNTADKNGVNRSNSASSNASGLGLNGPSFMGSPRSIRDLSKHQLASLRLQQLQGQSEPQPLSRALSQQEMSRREQAVLPSTPQASIIGSPGRVPKTPPSASTPRRARRNSAIRRSITDGSSMYGRAFKRSDNFYNDLLARELAHQADKYIVEEDIRAQMLQVKSMDHQEPSRASSEFSLQLSPQDLDYPSMPTRRSSLVAITENPQSEQEKQSATANAGNSGSKTSEATSRKEGEVSVIFTSIATASKSELKSKFQESFPERPVSPPAGYTNGPGPKRSMTVNSGKSIHSTKSLASPTGSTVHQYPPLLQQSASFSGVSTATSVTSGYDGKPRSGFMRAISSKLRPRQSDDQLRTSKTSDMSIGPLDSAPSVSFEPPRLELSFMGDYNPSELGGPPASAPAGSGANTLDSWKHEALNSLPLPHSHSGSGSQDNRPAGFNGARRSSATMIDSNSYIHRDQRFMSMGPSIVSAPLHIPRNVKNNGMAQFSSASGVSRQNHRGKGTSSDSSSSSSDFSGSAEELSTLTRQSSQSSLHKNDASEKEYRFSTSTLLKDGKLCYQLQWEEFSELGFKSDFSEPEQYHSGDHQLRTSQEDPRKQHCQGEAQGQEQGYSHSHVRTSTSGSRGPSLDRLGQLGQASRMSSQDQGPSPAQRAAAMKVARESFIALTNDPNALAALKARSENANGQPTIISSGSFARGSIHPKLDQFPMPPVITSKSISIQQQKTRHYPTPSTSPSSTQSHDMMTMDGQGQGNLQRSMSGKSSLTLSATEAALLSDSKTMKQPGQAVAGGGGLGSSMSLSSGNQADKRSATKPSDSKESKPKGASRFFGKKPKVANGSNGRKRRMFPVGVKRQDIMTKTVEPVDEVFPWMSVEHMAGQESGWVMLEPVQDGAVGWVMIDKLEDDIVASMRPQQQNDENLREQLQVA